MHRQELSGVAPETAISAFAAFQSMCAVHVGVACWSQLLVHVPVAYTCPEHENTAC